MSYQRAIINCKRCYVIAKQELSNLPKRSKSKKIKEILNGNDQLFAARDGAMQSIEQEIDYLNKCMTNFKYGDYYQLERCRDYARKALELCKGCDYKKPKIAEHFSE